MCVGQRFTCEHLSLSLFILFHETESLVTWSSLVCLIWPIWLIGLILLASEPMGSPCILLQCEVINVCTMPGFYMGAGVQIQVLVVTQWIFYSDRTIPHLNIHINRLMSYFLIKDLFCFKFCDYICGFVYIWMQVPWSPEECRLTWRGSDRYHWAAWCGCWEVNLGPV